MSAIDKDIAEVKALEEARAKEREKRSFTVTCNRCGESSIFSDGDACRVGSIRVGQYTYITCRCGNHIGLL